MAEISAFYGILIAIYFRGEVGKHNLPHIHIEYSDDTAVLAIEDGKLLAGGKKMPRLALRLVRTWLRQRRKEVMAEWTKARNGQRVGKVKPLPEYGRKGQTDEDENA